MLGLASACSYSSYIPFSTTKSLAFDGTNDYLDVGDNLDLGTGDFSISMWVYVTEATNNILMSKWQDANNFWVLRTQADDKIQFIAVIGGLTILSHISSEAISQNVWVHVVYTNDRSNGSTGERMYIDGVLKGAGGASSTTDIDNTGSLYIGRYDTTYTLASTKMDEVAIWNYDLNSEHVTALYDNGNPTELTSIKGLYSAQGSLQAWWRMGDGYLDSIGGTGEVTGVVADKVNASLADNLYSPVEFAWDFTNGSVTAWTVDDNATVASGNDWADITSGAETNEQIRRTLNTVIGEEYTVGFTRVAGGESSAIFINDSSPGSEVISSYTAAEGVELIQFVASTTTATIGVRSGTGGEQCFYDNFLVWKSSGHTHEFSNGTYSWVAEVSNTIANVDGHLAITYVDDSGGAKILFKDVADLSSDLVLGETYIATVKAKYTGGSPNVKLHIFDGATSGGFNSYSDVLTTDLESYKIAFRAESATAAYLKLNNLETSNVVHIKSISIRKVSGNPALVIGGVTSFSDDFSNSFN